MNCAYQFSIDIQSYIEFDHYRERYEGYHRGKVRKINCNKNVHLQLCNQYDDKQSDYGHSCH